MWSSQSHSQIVPSRSTRDEILRLYLGLEALRTPLNSKMKEVLYIMRFICTSEGISGFILNFILLCMLLRHHKSANQIFLVPIYVSSLVGLYLCAAIAVMNFNHIFHDGTLAVPLIGPAAEFFSKFWRDLLYQIAFVLMSFMWILTPATTILQFTTLSGNILSQWKRLLIAFTPTLVCLLFVAYTVPMTMPSPQLSEIMSKSMKELYGMEQKEFLECYGVSIKHAHINNNKSVVLFVVTFTAIPYSISYVIIVTLMIMIRRMLASQGFVMSKKTMHLQRQFFVMQLLQSFLPLAILSIPLAFIMYGALSGAQLGFWGLPLTIFVWLCPVVQGAVQLRYVMQSLASKPNQVQFSLSDALSRVAMSFSLESILLIIHTIISLDSISLNALLIYCVFFHTPSNFATFGIMLKFHALADFVTALGSTATMQRLIPIEFSLFYISYGPCGLFGATACYITYTILLCGTACTFYAILASFLFRLKVIKGHPPTTRDAFALISGIALPLPTIMMVALLASRDDDIAVRDLLNKLRPNYEACTHVVTGHTYIRTVCMFIVIFILAILTAPIFMIILRIRSQILASIQGASDKLSERSKKMNRKFVTMLTAQTVIPLIQFFSSNIAWINFALGFFDILHEPAMEYVTYLCIETAALFSPLIVLTSIDHYKRAALRVFCCNLDRNASNVSSTSVSMTRRLSVPQRI